MTGWKACQSFEQNPKRSWLIQPHAFLRSVIQNRLLAYNLAVPTPFYHLSVAKELLEHPDLPAELAAQLKRERAAFLFGNTAPDVQTISRQARQETHFFDIPLKEGARPPWELLLQSHPGYSLPYRLPSSQAAFILGYLCHLQADWLWVKQLFLPVFGKKAGWETLSRRLYLHNVLRSYLDQQVLPTLSNGTAASVTQARPDNWLPFVRDQHLYQWRDFLAEQLQPGAEIKTVEVFAARQGISPDEYYHLIASAERMETEVFSHLPWERLISYRKSLVAENLLLIRTYLQPDDILA